MLVAAVVLAVGIPAATIAHKQMACRDAASAQAVKAVDSCCPSKAAATADTAVKKEASCPYMGEKSAEAAKSELKHCPMPKSDKQCAKPAAKSDKCSKSAAKVKPAAKPTEPAVTEAAPKPAPESAAKPAEEKKVESAVCPVMKAEIPDVSKAAGSSVYKGKTYYFCCAGCKPAFDKDPEKYIGG